jgi:hypothetical protein
MVLRRLFAVCLLALAGCEAATAVLETVDELQQNSAPSSLTISTDAENEIATARPIGGARQSGLRSSGVASRFGFARSTFSFSAIHDRAMTRRWLTSLLRTTSSSCRSLFRRRTPGSFRTVPR